MALLSVNVNKIATLRNTRPLGIPSVIHLSKIALDAGAAGITVHPRPDQRHIRPEDVTDVAALLRNHYPRAEFNIEGNPFHEFVPHARETRPAQCTLVPDSHEQKTSDHGWDLVADAKRLGPMIEQLKGFGSRVSLFMDPDPTQMKLAKQLGADRVELYTEPYAAAFAKGDPRAADSYVAAADAALEHGLGLNAGHDLNLANLPHLVAKIPALLEVSIGHALVGDALEFGMTETVRRYIAAAALRPPSVLRGRVGERA